MIQNGLAASGGATATAANVPLRPDDLAVSGFPSQTVGHLRASGIVIAATAYRAGSSMAGLNFPVRDLPLRLTESEIVSWTDGGHRRSAYRFLANVRGQNLDVRVFFGSSKPGPAAFAEAQAELNKLIVAAAPPVTIAARPTLVTAYDPVTVFGRTADGKSGSEVRIEEKECGFTFFHAVGISTTAEGGNWTATVSGETTTTFRARWKNGTSDEVRVVVRPRLRLERNAAGRFTLVVQAMNRFIGKTVQIQRFGEASGRWRTVKRVALQRFDTQYGHGWSIATFRLPARAGLVRAVLPKSQVGACYAAGISPSVRT